ncbi:putative alfa-L-rhamnosidase [Microdochium trichocladiopsis]|uniref:alpha-L-rhamnosidase n=1 Tax=Microdochium trichocladiopsis TaxID=1682393 RepID=A0A9P9BSX4_9PEZI|nr:putative alfa-L-rhamnosidase [Microdochium trichocladiopsis]KAH7038335.1 putative alfa-L-rhamnosidase [Microdochium trichocladiopsis]
MEATSQQQQQRHEQPCIAGLRFEHYSVAHQLGTQAVRPRLSWKFANVPAGFVQLGYELEVYDSTTIITDPGQKILHREVVESDQSVLVPWPAKLPDLVSRQAVFARSRAADAEAAQNTIRTPWSEPASIETGLLDRGDWQGQLISSPPSWGDECQSAAETPRGEELYRAEFDVVQPATPAAVEEAQRQIRSARLYITAQGVYEAEINGRRVGDEFLAPGWTEYRSRLRYQCYDVTGYIHGGSSSNSVGGRPRKNVIGVRVAEGWFCGRLSWLDDSIARNHFGERPALLAQLEVTFVDGARQVVVSTDSSWRVTRGPTLLAELYDGEKYDARLEIEGWSGAEKHAAAAQWEPVPVRGPLPDTVALITGEAAPVRRIEVVRPVQRITTLSGKTILDFGQNLVGYTRIKRVRARRGHKITLSHAEVLEKGELGTRPLRKAANRDEYTCKGSDSSAGEGETWEPRFTFHGYRYVQVEGNNDNNDNNGDLLSCVETVVCHTDMAPAGSFSCSDELLNRLHANVTWSMRGNFLSIPTDCPQRDERLGWTGDIAMFAPTATLLYNCTDMLRGWLRDLAAEQAKHAGVPPLVVPNVLTRDPFFGRVTPVAVWGDVAVLAPWALYQASGDVEILREQYQSMLDWVAAIPRNKTGNTHLWKSSLLQLGDWLDPSAPPDNPAGGKTDAILVADAFLIHTLDTTAEVAALLHQNTDAERLRREAASARSQFAHEYLTPAGRLVSDSQTAYALAIVFGLFPSPAQRRHACDRLVYLVRRNAFKIGTGFAGTPYICEALTLAGHQGGGGEDVAYALLRNEECPSWLYSVKMGATTIWERYDSMLADGSVNPGEMTSFNHYALGAVARWMWERAAGLKALEAGWRRIQVAPVVGGGLTRVKAVHYTPYGKVGSQWVLEEGEEDEEERLRMTVTVPPNATAEVVFPAGSETEKLVVGSGVHEFSVAVKVPAWPVKPIGLFG